MTKITDIDKWHNTSQVERLIDALGNQDEKIRVAAAVALGNIRDARAIEPLIVALEDERLYPRLEASKSLGKIGSPAVDYLVKKLGKVSFNHELVPPEKAFWEKKFYVHDMAGRTLVRVGKPAVPALIMVVEGDDELLCQHAADALARIGDIRGVDPLMNALNRYSSNITVWKIIRALGEIGDQRSVETVAKFLHHPVDFIRWETADSLGKLKSKQCVTYLLEAIKDPHPEVRRTSARSLGKCKDICAVDPLILALENEKGGKPREDVRWESVKALGRIGGLKAKEALTKALIDGREDIREEATRALFEIDSY